jgi:GDPmannose 4,6-dehydratase
MPTAFITGITGQDGSYLTELLLNKGYMVHGTVRRSSNIEGQRLDHLTVDAAINNKRLFLHYADLSDTTTLRRLLRQAAPDEFYHLAGQSHVGLSFDIPESTCDFTAMGTLRILEILRDLNKRPRFLNIGSSEIFGRPQESPQSEATPMRPVSPYGVAKAFAVEITRVYREAHGFFACNAICYNHESPRRGLSFVTRKITRGVAEIALGRRKTLALGDLNTERDWGFAPEYVAAMWQMLQREEPDDYVLATGQLSSLRDFLSYAFAVVGLEWELYVAQDSRFMRLVEPFNLVGDPSKAARALGWTARTQVEDLARIMVESDLALLRSTAPTEALAQ